MPIVTLFNEQLRAFSAPPNYRIILYVGGIQCGKTTVGALWLTKKHMESGPGSNFIIATPDYKTQNQATLPKFRSFNRAWGEYRESKAEFKLAANKTVFCRTATHPESVEGITDVHGIWGDEAGLFSRYFFENLMGRAAFKQAQIFLTTTPYSMNWTAQLVDDAIKGIRDDILVVQLKSIDSPYFPKDEYERQRKLLDPRRFAMKYAGVFGQMEGLVYDKLNLCRSFALPSGTRYYAGLDWGYNPDPFALVIRAVTPDGKHYRVDEYYKNFLTITDICEIVKARNQIYNFVTVFCDPSQPAAIRELNRSAGVSAVGAENDVRYGIDLHFALIKDERFWIFEDMNPNGLDEYRTYHYPEDKELKYNQDSKERLPVKQNDHGCDADRYVSIELLRRGGEKRSPVTPSDTGERPRDHTNRLEWLKRRRPSRFEKVS